MLPGKRTGGRNVSALRASWYCTPRSLGQGLVDVAPQLVDERRLAVHEAEVEEDAEVGDVLRLGPAQPGIVGGEPVGQRAAPARVARP